MIWGLFDFFERKCHIFHNWDWFHVLDTRIFSHCDSHHSFVVILAFARTLMLRARAEIVAHIK